MELEELLEIIPDHIWHKKIKVDWDSNSNPVVRWTEDTVYFILRIEKIGRKYKSFYIHTGFEGETEELPLPYEIYKEYCEYGGSISSRAEYLLFPTLKESLEFLLCWLKKGGLLNKEAK